MGAPYRIPAVTQRTETVVANSRFIATVAHVDSVEAFKAFLASVRAEMPDASHHVYAYRVGYGNSVIEGMSDDGEPSGTSGPPVLAVLKGADLGDVAIVVTRYFGGTKLGTGGLVRAYSEAAHVAFNQLPTTLKIEKRLIAFEMPYTYLTRARQLVGAHNGEIEDETFTDTVTLLVRFPAVDVPAFADALTELSAGSIGIVDMDD